jgi:hypothetical protein
MINALRVLPAISASTLKQVAYSIMRPSLAVRSRATARRSCAGSVLPPLAVSDTCCGAGRAEQRERFMVLAL